MISINKKIVNANDLLQDNDYDDNNKIKNKDEKQNFISNEENSFNIIEAQKEEFFETKLRVIYSENKDRSTLESIIISSCNCGNYNESIDLLKILIEKFPKMDFSKKELIENSVKGYISKKQSTISAFIDILEKYNLSDIRSSNLIKDAIKSEENELKSTSGELIALIDTYMFKNTKSRLFEVFLFRLKADLFKYQFQYFKDQISMSKKSEEYYIQSIKLSEELSDFNELKEYDLNFPYDMNENLKKLLKNQLYLECLLSLCNFYSNYISLPKKTYYLLENIVKSPELQEFYRENKKFSSKEINYYLNAFQELFVNSEES